MQRPEDGSDVIGFGSFDNSTCKRVLDLFEPSDLRLGQVVIKRVAVVKLGVNNGSGDGGSCFGVEVWTDTTDTCSVWQPAMRQCVFLSCRFCHFYWSQFVL